MSIKLFVGFRITPELRGALSTSESWQRRDAQELLHIPHDGKEYIGRYLEEHHPTLKSVRCLASHLSTLLQKHLPELRVDKLPLEVFPELLVG